MTCIGNLKDEAAAGHLNNTYCLLALVFISFCMRGIIREFKDSWCEYSVVKYLYNFSWL